MQFNVYEAVERYTKFLGERDPNDATALDRGEFSALQQSLNVATAELLDVLVGLNALNVRLSGNGVHDEIGDALVPVHSVQKNEIHVSLVVDAADVIELVHDDDDAYDDEEDDDDDDDSDIESDLRHTLYLAAAAASMSQYPSDFVANIGTLAYLRSRQILNITSELEEHRIVALLGVVAPFVVESFERFVAAGVLRFVDGRRKPLDVSEVARLDDGPVMITLTKAAL